MASTKSSIPTRGRGTNIPTRGRGIPTRGSSIPTRGTSSVRTPVILPTQSTTLAPDYKQAGKELAQKVAREGLFDFKLEDLQLKPNAPIVPYYRRTTDEKTVGSWGQLKLFLGILEFICLYHKKSLIPRPLVLYIGAAPGLSFPLLSEMFPDFTWDLWDGADFGFEPNEKITIHNSYFFDKDALEYKAQSNRILFMSDIRTVDSRNAERRPVEEGIWKDMLMQQEWVKIINPFAANLKFRLPYSYTFTPSHVNYLSGRVLLQSFVGPTSTETRLVPDLIDGKYEEVTWDTRKYEEQMMYHNAVVREKALYKVPITEYAVMPETDDIINNYDGCYMVYVFNLYLDYIGYPSNTRVPDSYEYKAYQDERLKTILALSLWVREYILSKRKTGKSFRDIKIYTRRFMAGDHSVDVDPEDLDDEDIADVEQRGSVKPMPTVNIPTASLFAAGVPNIPTSSLFSNGTSLSGNTPSVVTSEVPSFDTLIGLENILSVESSDTNLPSGFVQPGSPRLNSESTVDLSSVSNLLTDFDF